MALKDYIESDLSNVDHAIGTGEAARMAGAKTLIVSSLMI